MKSENKKHGEELPLTKQTCSQRKRTFHQTGTLACSSYQTSTDYSKNLYGSNERELAAVRPEVLPLLHLQWTRYQLIPKVTAKDLA